MKEIREKRSKDGVNRLERIDEWKAGKRRWNKSRTGMWKKRERGSGG